jgi:hypothetical protein
MYKHYIKVHIRQIINLSHNTGLKEAGVMGSAGGALFIWGLAPPEGVAHGPETLIAGVASRSHGWEGRDGVG